MRRVLVANHWAAAILAALVLGSCSSGNSAIARPAARSTSTRPAHVVGAVRVTDLDAGALARMLRANGFATFRLPGQIGGGLQLGVPRLSICVDHQLVQVYEYATDAQRKALSDGIDPTGTSIRNPAGTTAEIDWVASPHFYARGRLIVLYLGSDPRIIGALTRDLGSTISPNASAHAGDPGRC